MTITVRVTNEGNEGDAQVGVYDAQNNLKGELMRLPAQSSGNAFLILRMEDGDAVTIEPFGQAQPEVDDETPDEKSARQAMGKAAAAKASKPVAKFSDPK